VEAKARFSEIFGSATIGKEGFLIHKHGNPVGAIISAEELADLERRSDKEPGGILATTGALAEFDDFFAILDDVVKSRHTRISPIPAKLFPCTDFTESRRSTESP
jgi:hypothetical protein